MSFIQIDNNESFRRILRDIFQDSFMRQYTRFQSFEGFCYSSAVIANWNADPMVYNEELLDRFVQESTDFEGWEQMVKAAADLRFSAEGAALRAGTEPPSTL